MNKFSVAALFKLLLLVVVCGSVHAASTAASGRQPGEMHYQGRDRSYLLYIPAGYNAERAVPLVVVLHGGHGSADKAFDRTGFHHIADREGFIVAYPEAVGEYWNDGRTTTASDVDDVAFIDALITHVGKQRNINRQKVYVTGLSNGGMMTQRLACEAPERFAAFASVIANLPVAMKDRCQPKQAVAMMMVNGEDDPLMPPAGGDIRKGRWMGVGGKVLSTLQTARFWSGINQCQHDTGVAMLPDRDPDDGTRIKKTRFSGCRQGGDVVLYQVEGGGHTWPGSSSRPFFKRLSGRTSNDMVATEEIWRFFQQH